ncbi:MULTISPECIES: hypothetical protein [unclassified Methanoculleus]|uniref:hypothetical protein n=1 Tax=unclassified Methanoculleus TaxID=2619537 RepID=UPI0025F7E1B6|nr:MULTISPECIES: hypothetical protein [unclassified Methanoculleus]MCK9297337.1 hypothetical protein [Methanoculleus sp.]MDD2254046.1 hypothetical protein [Methanoculleus sp.]MDD2786604.1 hypothetical protein [Methanoculleus sp.]MDD3216449.1 hypothetical protein [Methanoculleus sp.]MDD4313355.1 hypothetical protein [Methanoculleus sp.]
MIAAVPEIRSGLTTGYGLQVPGYSASCPMGHVLELSVTKQGAGWTHEDPFKTNDMTGKYVLKKSVSRSLPKRIINRTKKCILISLNKRVAEDLCEPMVIKLHDPAVIGERCAPEITLKILRGTGSCEPVESFRPMNQVRLLFMFALNV